MKNVECTINLWGRNRAIARLLSYKSQNEHFRHKHKSRTTYTRGVSRVESNPNPAVPGGLYSNIDITYYWCDLCSRILQQPKSKPFFSKCSIEIQQWCHFRAPSASQIGAFGLASPQKASSNDNSPSSEPLPTHFLLIMYEESGCLDDELKSLLVVFALLIFHLRLLVRWH